MKITLPDEIKQVFKNKENCPVVSLISDDKTFEWCYDNVGVEVSTLVNSMVSQKIIIFDFFKYNKKVARFNVTV